MKYKHITHDERYYIEIEHRKGTSVNKIAKSLGRSQSTISREINRNTGLRGYRSKQAGRFAEHRLIDKPKAVKLTDKVKFQINQYLQEDWSPEQIAGRFKHDGIISLHHETIYRYIYADKAGGGSLHTHLRHKDKKYRKRYGTYGNRSGIPDRVDIDKRPAIVAKRKRLGDWEADTIIGKNNKGAILTLDERKSKIRLAMPLKTKKAQPLTDAAIGLLMPIKKFVRTITFDNGKEFAMHKTISKFLRCGTYFAKPYHSWERGQNENANGLLRQYFPKAMELDNVNVNSVIKAVDKLNSRPRKCLGFKTPYETFHELSGIDLKNLVGVMHL